MDSVAVCRGCGRLLEKDFIYCPWCGMERNSVDSEEIMDGVFDKLENMAEAGHEKRVKAIKNKLDSLESELNNLVSLGAESKK